MDSNKHLNKITHLNFYIAISSRDSSLGRQQHRSSVPLTLSYNSCRILNPSCLFHLFFSLIVLTIYISGYFLNFTSNAIMKCSLGEKVYIYPSSTLSAYRVKELTTNFHNLYHSIFASHHFVQLTKEQNHECFTSFCTIPGRNCCFYFVVNRIVAIISFSVLLFA